MFNEDNDEERMRRVQEVIDEMLSPCDQPLIDLAGNMVEDIGMVKDILADRNNEKVTLCFALGIISTLIQRLISVDVSPAALIKFLNEQADNDED